MLGIQDLVQNQRRARLDLMPTTKLVNSSIHMSLARAIGRYKQRSVGDHRRRCGSRPTTEDQLLLRRIDDYRPLAGTGRNLEQ